MKASEALQKVGNAGRYQKIVLVYLCIYWIGILYMLLGPSYIYMNPTFICASTGDRVLEEQQACPIIDECTFVDSHTITVEVGLYCDRQVERDMIQAVMYIGSISGLIIMNIISDRYGRKVAFLGSTALCLIGSIFVTIGAYTHVIAMLAIGQLLTGFGSYSTYIISYVILSDSFSDKWRQIGIISVNASWAVGEISFCLLYNCFNRWEYFMIGCLVIPLAGWLVLGQFLLIESPVFLLGHSRRKCLVALNKIAAWNNQPPLTLEQIQPSPKPEEQASAFEVFKSWAYIKPILLIGLFATTVNIFYYGTQYCMDDIGSNFGFNMLIVGCLEFSAYFSSTFFVQKIKRKRSMIIICSMVGGCCSLFVFKTIRQSKVAQMIIVPFGRFLITYCMGLLALFMNQSFPDAVKSSGAGSVQALSNLGNIVTPFIVSLTTDAGLNSVFVVGVILLFGIIPLVPTRETYHHVATEEALKESLISDAFSESEETRSGI